MPLGLLLEQFFRSFSSVCEMQKSPLNLVEKEHVKLLFFYHIISRWSVRFKLNLDVSSVRTDIIYMYTIKGIPEALEVGLELVDMPPYPGTSGLC